MEEEEEEKRDLITISARKSSREWPVLNQIGQRRPWGVVREKEGGSVREDSRTGRWRGNERVRNGCEG